MILKKKKKMHPSVILYHNADNRDQQSQHVSSKGSTAQGSRPGLIFNLNHDYLYLIEIFFNQKLFCNRTFLRLKVILFLFEYFQNCL